MRFEAEYMPIYLELWLLIIVRNYIYLCYSMHMYIDTAALSFSQTINYPLLWPHYKVRVERDTICYRSSTLKRTTRPSLP